MQVLVQPTFAGNGDASNAAVILVGNSGTQLIALRPDDAGMWIPASDRNKIYVKGTIGDKVRIIPAT